MFMFVANYMFKGSNIGPMFQMVNPTIYIEVLVKY